MKKDSMKDVLKQLKKIYIERGSKHLCITLFDYILMQFIAIGHTYKLELDKIEYIPQNKGLTFRKMNIQDVNLIYQVYKNEIDEKVYQDLLGKLKDSNYDGFIMKKYDEICGYCFINYKNTYPILKKNYIDINNNGYLLTDYVFKKYRGQKIQQYGIYERLQILKMKNFKTATSLVSKDNYPSRKSYERFGFKKCVRCYFFRFGKQWRSKDHFKIL